MTARFYDLAREPFSLCFSAQEHGPAGIWLLHASASSRWISCKVSVHSVDVLSSAVWLEMSSYRHYSKGDNGSVKVLISHAMVFFLSPSPKQVTSHHNPRAETDLTSQWKVAGSYPKREEQMINSQKKKKVCIEALHLSIIECSILRWVSLFFVTVKQIHAWYFCNFKFLQRSGT